MNPISITILAFTLLTILIMVIYNYKLMSKTGEDVFKGSGKPEEMAQSVIASIKATFQFMYGITIIAILCVLMSEKVIEDKSGMPLISAIVGYLLSKKISGKKEGK